jgi:ubiquinone/menaquinone biosynthesis C-methylase UbiE
LCIEFYGNDKERWDEIDRVRKKVAKHLHIASGSLVLDVLVGEGDFARAVAKSSKQTHVVAGEILGSDLQEAKRRIQHDKLKERVELLKMDVTHMAFTTNCFGYVVSFLGWEDFVATSGEELVDRAFSEMVRVLKANGALAVTFNPALTATDKVSRKDRKLREYIYKGSRRPKFFQERFFHQMLEEHGISLIERVRFETPKSRLKPSDARAFLKWCCSNCKSYYPPDVEMRDYEEIIGEFGSFIEKYGIRETRSEFILLIGKKA